MQNFLDFVLFDWLNAQDLPQRERFAEHSRETFAAVMDTASAIAAKEFAPINRLTDVQEPSFDGNTVTLPAQTKQALQAFIDAGLLSGSQSEQWGGMQLPFCVEMAALSYFYKANIAVTGYAMLTQGNANLLQAYGTAHQQEVFVTQELAGRWFGTMCLSEPQAGSSLSDIATRAVLENDADSLGPRYRLTGNKMWISGGEHELTENIVHLVLAKIPGANGQLPSGVKGISLFIVPKRMVHVDTQGVVTVGERNDVVLAGLNHKLGYRGTTNTLLNFGEGKFKPDGKAGAVGYLVGQPGQGLQCMFHMMNEARIGVGLGATMLGMAGYDASLEYAKQRTQGRAIGPSGKDPSAPQIRLIEHADIRSMLLAQKAYCQGALALELRCARLVDDVNTGSPEQVAHAKLLLEILTPIAKSWPSQWCLEANSLAIQVLGGYGYTRDFPVEQYWRDNRLNMIHEGTHGIQALDLLGRKVTMQQGAALKALAAQMLSTCEQAAQSKSADTRDFAQGLQRAAARVGEVTQQLWSLGDPQRTTANATAYMQAFGHVVLAWVWLELSLSASKAYAPERSDFLHGVWQACKYYYVWELPKAHAWLDALHTGDLTVLDMQEAWFA